MRIRSVRFRSRNFSFREIRRAGEESGTITDRLAVTPYLGVSFRLTPPKKERELSSNSCWRDLLLFLRRISHSLSPENIGTAYNPGRY